MKEQEQGGQAEYIDAKGLAAKLAVSVKWVSKHSFKIPGRVKVSARAIRYHLPTIEKRLAGGSLLPTSRGK